MRAPFEFRWISQTTPALAAEPDEGEHPAVKQVIVQDDYVFLNGSANDVALIELATQHRDTVFAALTHTQPAQPTTVAHYLLAVIEQLERDHVRLRAGYTSTNRCPLGSCAITGTGFDIDRQLTSDLLGFDGPTGNTYGSIATADYLLETAGAPMLRRPSTGL